MSMNFKNNDFKKSTFFLVMDPSKILKPPLRETED